MKKSLLPREIGKQINNLPISKKHKQLTREIIRRVNRYNIENDSVIDLSIDYLPENKGSIIIIELFCLLIKITFDYSGVVIFDICGEVDNRNIWEQLQLINSVLCIKNGPHLKLSL